MVGAADGYWEYWGGFRVIPRQHANAGLQQQKEGYFDGWSPGPILQHSYSGDSSSRAGLRRSGSSGSNSAGPGLKLAESGERGERLRGAIRLGGRDGKRGKVGPNGGGACFSVVLCAVFVLKMM